MKRINLIISGLFIASILFSISTNSAYAQEYTTFGVRMGIYTDVEDLFLGAEMNVPIGKFVYFNPNLEYILIDRGTFMTFNFDFHYDFPTSSPVYIWAGGGPAVVYVNPDGPIDSETDLGLNLLFGLGFPTGNSLIPYVQGKALLGDRDDFVLGFGLRF